MCVLRNFPWKTLAIGGRHSRDLEVAVGLLYARGEAVWVTELSSVAYDPLLQKTGIQK